MTTPEANGQTPPATAGQAAVEAELFATRASTVSRNAISSYLPLIVSMALGLVVTPVFVRALSAEDFGLWSVGLGMIAYLGILDAGVGTAVVTRIGHAGGRRDEVERVSRSATAVYLAVGTACGVATLALAWAAPSILDGNQASGVVQGLFLFLGTWQIVNLVLAVPSGALQGSGRYGSFAVYAAAVAVVTAGAQALTAVTTHDVSAVAAATAGCGVVAFTASHVRARRTVPGYTFSPRRADRATIGSLYRLGWRNAIIFIAASLGYGSDVVIVGLVAGARAAAVYAIASRAGQFAIALGTRASASMTGSYSTLATGGQFERIWRLYQRATQIALLTFLPLAVALIGFGHGLLVDWVGHLGAASYPILVVIVASGAVQVAGHNAFILITATEQSARIVRLSVLSGVVNVSLSIVLTTQIGAIGAAYGSLVTTCLIDTVALPLIAARVCRSDLRTMLPVIGGLMVPLLSAVAVCVAFRLALGQHGAFAVVGALATVTAFFLGCLFSRSQREDLLDLVDAVRGRR